SQVYIEGRLETSTYEKDGQTHYSTDIIANEMQMLGGRSGMGGNDYSSSGDDQRPRPQAAKPGAVADDFDDDIPF
ncbi:MAG TPA: single-stranded DNA-binding protein, partial [Gammaproteobacteria bacterium]|nr:single-stranded DNA-binding protein [Gammaproteobacteria bacterium]